MSTILFMSIIIRVVRTHFTLVIAPRVLRITLVLSYFIDYIWNVLYQRHKGVQTCWASTCMTSLTLPRLLQYCIISSILPLKICISPTLHISTNFSFQLTQYKVIHVNTTGWNSINENTLYLLHFAFIPRKNIFVYYEKFQLKNPWP